MQLFHDFVLLFETISKRLVLPTCKVNFFTCHVEEFLSHKPYLIYQFETKIEELSSEALSSN